MTKKEKKSTTVPGQGTIFEWLCRADEASRHSTAPARGSLNVDFELRAAISEDIRNAREAGSGRELSRAEVAARMTDLQGEEISLAMLNNYTSEAHTPHRFPAQFLPAFVIATGGQRRAFETLSRRAGLFALPGPEALRAEIQRFDEVIAKSKHEKQKRMIFLREIEAGQ